MERDGRDTDRTMRRRAAQRLPALFGPAASGEAGQALLEEEEAAARLTARAAGGRGGRRALTVLTALTAREAGSAGRPYRPGWTRRRCTGFP